MSNDGVCFNLLDPTVVPLILPSDQAEIVINDDVICKYLQAKLYPRVLAAMKPGATLGLSHGFLLGVMQNDGVDFRDDINVVLNAPKVRTGFSALHCMHMS